MWERKEEKHFANVSSIMLAPESLFFDRRAFTEKKGQCKVAEDCVSENGHFHFRVEDNFEPIVVRKMSIVLPGFSQVPSELQLALTNDTEYYKAKRVESIAALLFSRDFVKTFCFQGDLFIGSHIDNHTTDSFLRVRPNGDLLICLDKPNSERIGFAEAKRYEYGKGRTLIVMNLRSCFTASDGASLKLIQRWRTELAVVEHLFMQPYTLSWTPYDSALCPSTVAKFFQDNGAIVEEIEADVSICRKDLYWNQVPVLYHVDEQGIIHDESEIDFDALEDWMGAISLNLSNTILDDMAVKASLEATKKSGEIDVSIINAEGVFTASVFKKILMSLQQLASRSKSNNDWIVMTTFPDVSSLHLLQPNNMKTKQFVISSRTLVAFKDSIFTRSKRG